MDNRTYKTVNDVNQSEMPKLGYLLIYFGDGIEFCKYNSRMELEAKMALWQERILLEVHAFNETYEWRWIVSRRKGSIEKKIEDIKEDKDNFSFVENVLVIPKYQNILKTIKMINYMGYDENDMLYVKGYRLAPGEEM